MTTQLIFLFLFYVVDCALYSRQLGWLNGRSVYYYNFTTPDSGALTNNVYVVRWANGSIIPHQNFLQYNNSAQLWGVYNVFVNDSYDFSKTSWKDLDLTNSTSADIFWNCPNATEDSQLEVPSDALLDSAWVYGVKVWFWNFGENPYSFGNTIWALGKSNKPVFQFAPGEAGYTAFIREQFPTDGLPKNVTGYSEINLTMWTDANASSWNCPIVELAPASEYPAYFPIIFGWYKNQTVEYYDFKSNSATQGGGDSIAIGIAPIYSPQYNGSQIGRNIIDVLPGDPHYSDLWQVIVINVPAGYIANTLKSVDEVLRSGYQLTNTTIFVNCPVVNQGSELQNSSDSRTIFGWYDNRTVQYFDFGVSRVFTRPIAVVLRNGTQYGNNVLKVSLNDIDYTPFWQVYAYTLQPSDDQTVNLYRDFDTATSHRTYEKTTIVVNCPVVRSQFVNTSIVTTNTTSVVTFIDDIWPILRAYAAGHLNGGASGGFSLSNDPNVSYTTLTTHHTNEVPALYYIHPNDVHGSYLFHKINGTQSSVGGSGARMPYGGSPLPQNIINQFQQWIEQGAQYQNNMTAAQTSPSPTPPTPTATPTTTPSSQCPAPLVSSMVNGQVQCFFKCVDLDLNFHVCYNLTDTAVTLAVTAPSSGWIGFGFSHGGDMPMVGSTACIGWNQGSNAKIDAYYLAAKDVSQIKPVPGVLTSAQVQDANGQVTLFFTRPLVVNGSANVPSINISTPTNVIWAQGASAELIQHANREFGTITFESGDVTVTESKQYITAHAVLMALAWGFVIPTGVLVARFGKRTRPPCWFYFHRVCNLLGLFMMLAGFVIALVKFDTPDTGLFRVHSDIGMTIFACGWFQALWALKRPTNDYPNVPRFFWARVHWWVGRSTLILAYVQIPIGMVLLNADRKYVILYVCGVAVMLAITIIIQWKYDWNSTSFGKPAQASEQEPMHKPAQENENGGDVTIFHSTPGKGVQPIEMDNN